MADQLVIEHLEFQGHCGVTEEERLIPQPIAVDLIVDYPPQSMSASASTDDISKAIDYARVAERVMDTGTSQSFHLLETLTDGILTMLFAEFPVERIRLWVRKVGSPVKQVQGSVGVRVERTRRAPTRDPQPASFLVDYLHLLPKGTALDVATGQGRNALYLAAQGFTVEAIDRDEQALASLESTATQRRLTTLTTRRLDLEADPQRPPDLGQEAYDAITVFYYLYRPLFPSLIQTLKPGGVLMYETFLIDNHVRHQHPRRREFCLAHNELLELTTGLRILYYDEGEHLGGPANGSAFTARLIARKEKSGGSY